VPARENRGGKEVAHAHGSDPHNQPAIRAQVNAIRERLQAVNDHLGVGAFTSPPDSVVFGDRVHEPLACGKSTVKSFNSPVECCKVALCELLRMLCHQRGDMRWMRR